MATERTDPLRTGPLHVVTDGPVTIITIDRPHVANALDIEAQRALAASFDAFERDEGQRVAILTGAGGHAFCAGHDLRTASPRSGDELPAAGFGGLTARFDMTKPLVAAVEGACVGGGFEMALACDLIVAGKGTRFGLPEVRVGMVALAGGLLRLTRAVGPKRAADIALTGRLITAEEAWRLGLVSEVVSDGDALAAALRWARRIADTAPLACRATKQVLLALSDAPLDEAMRDQWRLAAVARWNASDEAAEGARAFIGRRPPRWRNGADRS